MFKFLAHDIELGRGVSNLAFMPTTQLPLFSPIGPGVAISTPFREIQGPQAWVRQALVVEGLAGIPTGDFKTGALLTEDEERQFFAGG